MIIELLHKDFGLYRALAKSREFWIGFVVRMIVMLGTISVISYMTYWMDRLISDHSEYFGFNTLVFFLAMAFLIQIFDGLIMARDMTFDHVDHVTMSPLIISRDAIVFSKMIFVYIFQIVDGLVLSTPMLVMYGVGRQFIPYYYIFCALYPLFLALISVGVIFILVVPFQLIHHVMKDRYLVRFLIMGVFMIGVTYLYGIGFDVYLKMLEGYGYEEMFAEGFIDSMFKLGPYLAPFYQLLTAICRQQQIISGVCTFLGTCLLSPMVGFIVSYFFYEGLVRRNDKSKVRKNIDKPRRKISMKGALIEKELQQTLGKGDNLFSFALLLVMMPLLMYVVLSPMKRVLIGNMRIVTDMVPDLETIVQLLVVYIFLAIVQMQTTQPYSGEEENLKTIKLLPLKDKSITLIKILVPFCLTGLSFIVSMIVCLFTGIVSLTSFFMIILNGLLYLAFIAFGGVMVDMADLRGKKHTSWISFYVVSCLYSLILTGTNILMEFGVVKGIYLLAFDACLTGALAISMIVLYFVRGSEYFAKMEVSV